MNLGLTIAIIVLGAGATAALGAWLAQSPYGAATGIPALAIGVWQAWRGHHREQAMQRQIDEAQVEIERLKGPPTHQQVEEMMRRQASIEVSLGRRPFD